MIGRVRSARAWHWLGAVALATLHCPSWSGPLSADSPAADARAWMSRVQQAAMTLNYQGTLVFNAAGVVSSSRVVHYCEGKQRYERIDVLDGEARQVLRHNDLTQQDTKRARTEVRTPERVL